MESLDVEAITNEVREFIGDDNLTYLREEFPDSDKLCLIYTSRVNFAGIQLRNYVREKFPDIDNAFKNKFGDNWYGEFEDWFHKIIIKVVYG